MTAPTTALDFFQHPDVQFPLERRNDDYFPGFVGERISAYWKLVQEMQPADSITAGIQLAQEKIFHIGAMLSEAIQAYERGWPHLAYTRLETALTDIPEAVRPFLTRKVEHGFVKELYRIRQEPAPGTVFSREELFHIPFELQHKVARQRYSIPGLPCLYLGGSLYICWEELGRLSTDSLHIARFEPAPEKTISVLDFMERPRHRVQGLIENPDSCDDPAKRDKNIAWAVCWPLMAMASIRRKHGDSPFIAEYIIPQLLLQWITQNSDDIDGIAYSSVRYQGHAHYPALMANFVFPAKEIAPSGYCGRLAQKFALTKPVPWSLLSRVMIYYTQPTAWDQRIELIPGQQTSYYESDFCKIEGKVRTLPAETLSP